MPALKASLFLAAVVLAVAAAPDLAAADKDLLPPRLSKDQRENLQRFLDDHAKPDRFLPADAKAADAPTADLDAAAKGTADKPVKQYVVQITPHRPVPGEEEPKRVDVYYYRPHPEKGKPGITVKHTVDLTTGKQVGPTEVLLKRHSPISREELAEAVALAREKSAAVQALYKGRDEDAVHWEYLQLMIARKQDAHEPGDRVVRFVFTAGKSKDATAPEPVAVIVNLTRGVVTSDAR
jgi:hypothetical protein